MPDPVIPARPSDFQKGDPISAKALNDLQTEILRLLVEHDHTGAEGKAEPLMTDAYRNRSVTEPKLADGAISARTIGDGSVGEDQLADGAVTAEKVADGAIGTAQIADDAVTEPKLAPDVRVLLRRTGESASSYSQVIWRDPLVLVAVDTGPSILEAFVAPEKITWGLNNIVVTAEAEVIELDFDEDDLIRPSPIDFEAAGPSKELIGQIAAEEVIATAFEMTTVGAVERGTPTGLFSNVTGSFVTAPPEAFGETASPGFNRFMTGAPQPQMMASPQGGAGASSPRSDVAMMRRPLQPMMHSTAQPNAARDATARTEATRAEASTTADTAPKEEVEPSVRLTETGQMGADRMGSIGAIDAAGRSVPFGTDGSVIVTSGFAGKQTFLPEGEDIDFADLNTEHERQIAIEAANRTLYNLGVDEDYIGTLDDENADLFLKIFENDASFWKVPDNPFITGKGWLGEALNWPTLFGSGYAISGGRNILDVVRVEDNDLLPSVRVRFITPYQNAAYAVCVTPSYDPDFRMMTAQVRNKSVNSFEIVFSGQRASDGGFVRTNKLSFDLAVFGTLQVTS